MAVYNWVVDDALDTSGMRGDFDPKKVLAARRKKAEKKKRELAAIAARAKREEEQRLRAQQQAAKRIQQAIRREEREEEAEERRIARQEASIQQNLKKQLEAKLKEGVERLFAATPVVLNEAMVAMIREARADAPGALSRLDDGTKNEIINTVLGKLVEGQSVTSFTGIPSPETVYVRRFQPSKSQNPAWEDLLRTGIITKDVEFSPEEFVFETLLPTTPPSDALLERKEVLANFWKNYIAYRIRAAQAAAAAADPFE